MKKAITAFLLLSFSACTTTQSNKTGSSQTDDTEPLATESMLGPSGQPVDSATADAIRSSLRAQETAFRKCYVDGVRLHPSSSRGTVVTFFTIQANGRISGVTVEGSSLNSPEVEACVLQTIWNTKFTIQKDAAPTRVTYPFSFAP